MSWAKKNRKKPAVLDSEAVWPEGGVSSTHRGAALVFVHLRGEERDAR